MWRIHVRIFLFILWHQWIWLWELVTVIKLWNFLPGICLPYAMKYATTVNNCTTTVPCNYDKRYDNVLLSSNQNHMLPFSISHKHITCLQKHTLILNVKSLEIKKKNTNYIPLFTLILYIHTYIHTYIHHFVGPSFCFYNSRTWNLSEGNQI
jgi:hypothetical protein